MREIKFRGRRKNSTEWVYGAFLAIPRLCSYIYDVQPDGQATRYLVDEDAVGQFTGLCDCKGQDIYEGDVVAFGDFFREHDVKNAYWHGVVKWSFEGARFVLDKLEFDEDVCNDELLVIGNVYDNPELIKK